MIKKLFIIACVLAVIGAAAGGALYYAYPNQMAKYAGMTRNYFLIWSAPPGTTTTELNAAYKDAGNVASPPPAEAVAPAEGTSPRVAAGGWPSYNRTLTSERYSPLSEINTKNVGGLKVLCTYDIGRFTAFESGLIMVDGALIGTTEFDIFSLNPATCAENWRTHEDYPPALMPVNRGAAYMDGMLFRGTQDGRALAYDFKTGKRIWETTIGDPKKGESAPAAPIAWNGLVFIGNAGGDIKGVKGRMYALDAKTGKIVWEFYLVPKAEGDPTRGPQGTSPLDKSTWGNSLQGVPITGGATWTSYTLDPDTGLLYVPGGNPAPDFAADVREGSNLYSGSVVVLDAETGAYKNHFKIVPKDWHDWDVSGAPAIIKTAGHGRLPISPEPSSACRAILAARRCAMKRRPSGSLAFGTALAIAIVIITAGTTASAQSSLATETAALKANYKRPPPLPAENQALVTLGQLLFWDTRASASGKTACVSCHLPNLGWSVTEPRSRNDSGKLTSRKSPTLLAIGYLPPGVPNGWDGRNATLEAQIKSSSTNGSMSMRETDKPVTIEVIETRIRAIPEYAKGFQAALPGMPIKVDAIARAIAAYEKTFEPGPSTFDRWIEGDEVAISDSAKRGFVIDSATEVMLITSRGTGRWIIPKGWPMKRRAPHFTAAREALEEAGVLGQIGKMPIGSFSPRKVLKQGRAVICDVEVFPLEVTRQRKTWPEKGKRKVRWFSPSDAAKAVPAPSQRYHSRLCRRNHKGAARISR